MKTSSRLLVGLGLLLAAAPVLSAQPTPHHFTGLILLPDRAVTLSLDGSVANIFSLTGRLKDLQFLVGGLARLNASDPVFAGRLDVDRVGVSGISLGGVVVETCRSDSRVKCAALWEGADLQLNSAGLQKPFLAELAETTGLYSENQWLFSKAATNAILLQVRRANHQTGSDAGWTYELPWGRAPALAINACFVWFFDTHLKGEAPPFPSNPEIYNVQRK